MNKIDIKLSELEIKKVYFQDNPIEVNPYINLENKYTLLNNYANVLNNVSYDETRKYVEAEYGVKLGIIDLQTNINVENLEIDKILSSGLFDKVIENITNYFELREDIAEIVDRVNNSKSASIAFVKMTDKVIEFLDTISKVDLSQEGITNLLSSLNAPLEEVKKFYPVVQSGEKIPTVSKRKSKKDIVL
jgi:hypothetical protein